MTDTPVDDEVYARRRTRPGDRRTRCGFRRPRQGIRCPRLRSGLALIANPFGMLPLDMNVFVWSRVYADAPVRTDGPALLIEYRDVVIVLRH